MKKSVKQQQSHDKQSEFKTDSGDELVGTTVGQKSLQAVEKVLHEKNYSLAFHTDDGLSVLICYAGPLFYPPVLVSVVCHGHEQYAVMYEQLAEVGDKQPFDLSRFKFVESSEVTDSAQDNESADQVK